VLGIVLGGSAGAYVNVLFNYRALSRKVGGILSGTEWRWIALGFAAAIIATIAGLLIASVVTLETVWLAALAVLVAFGAAYLSVTALPGHPDAQLR
jgi:peptidoglycan biosynthesis protein MviN/MurJ (putative lipid II flippase)